MLSKTAIFLILQYFLFAGVMFTGQAVAAENLGRKIQKYVKESTELQARKRQENVTVQNVKGRKINYYLIKKSALESKRGKADTAAQKMQETGLVTANMVKNNRWFVKQPFQRSFTKIEDIKPYSPPRPNPEKTEETSRDALKMTKQRAYATGPVKPETLYSSNSSRDALKMTKQRAYATGPVKPETLYSSSSSRDVLKMSRTRALETGAVKPEILYSSETSRGVQGLAVKISRKNVYAGQNIVYTADKLISLSKRPPVDYTPFNNKIKAENKKSAGDNTSEKDDTAKQSSP
ncbi:MAG: hypothetical protein ISR93_09705 [SAR324 cluster bacterium]|nr:hypothetical protein [SAR324 cluster bacterium]